MSSGTGTKRVVPLALITLALGGAVWWSWSRPSGDDGAESDSAIGLREQYLAELELTRQQQQLVAGEAKWSASLERAREQWNVARHELVRAKTVELAEASLRERVLAEVKDLKFLASRANSVPAQAIGTATATGASAPDATLPIRPIALRVEVDTDSPAEVYRLIDRLENLPDLRACVTQVRVEGPGFKQTPWQVSATIQLQALALVGEEG